MAGGVIDLQGVTAGHAALAHAAGHDGSVRGHPAAGGQNAPRGDHALDVLGTGLDAHEDHLGFGIFVHGLFGVFRVEDNSPRRGARRSRQALGQHVLFHARIKHGVQQLVQLIRFNALDRFGLADQSIVFQIDGDLHRRGGRALAGARLQKEQLAFLDGKLHVLHIAVMFLQPVFDLYQLAVNLGHFFSELTDGRSRAGPRDDVFALGVDEVLAEKGVLAR